VPFSCYRNSEYNGPSLSITNAPPRAYLDAPNVFRSQGRPKKMRRRRARTNVASNPNIATIGNNAAPHSNELSILDRLDLSIRRQFGDWREDGNNEMMDVQHSKLLHPADSIRRRRPSNFSERPHIEANKTPLALPKLFRHYDSIALEAQNMGLHNGNNNGNSIVTEYGSSKDNDDPDSVLSHAKRTLAQLAVSSNSGYGYS